MLNGLAEIAQTAHRLNPALETQGPVTFRPAAAVLEDWNAWCAGVWLPILSPVLFRALDHSRSGRLRELGELDLELSDRLSSEAIRASTSAGSRLLANAGSLRGEKWPARFRELIETGQAGGHLLTVHALRAAAFHGTDPQVAGSYLYQEAVGGLFPNHPRLLGECVEGAMRMERSTQPALRVA